MHDICALDWGSSSGHRGAGSAVVPLLLSTVLEDTSWSTSQIPRQRSSFFPCLSVFHPGSAHKHCLNPSWLVLLRWSIQTHYLGTRSLWHGVMQRFKKKKKLQTQKQKTRKIPLWTSVLMRSQERGPRGASTAAWLQTVVRECAVPALMIRASCWGMRCQTPN